jgi:hypothetical protein
VRNQFNLSCEHKTSVNMGQLIPVWCEEVLPGDTMRCRHTALARIAPLAQPLMHRVELRMHSFYVPNRIQWDQWEDFITGEDESATLPVINPSRSTGDVLDYMGVPPALSAPINPFYLNAYNRIYNEFFRDQDLQAERDLFNTAVARCAWQKDYFTIARPTTQQGTAIDVPFKQGAEMSVKTRDGTGAGGADPLQTNSVGAAFAGTILSGQRLVASPEVGDALGAIAIDDLRRSIALQRFAEARMRFGSRYVDYLRYLGVNPSDGRLDRPEYLGGGKELLSFSEVLATAEGTDTNVGDLYGHGIGMGRTNGWQKMFEEHGVVMTLLSIRPKSVYQNSTHRRFARGESGPMDYWQKELEVLPWQEISAAEVDAAAAPEDVFGYVPRYEEYRHGISYVSNTMRTSEEDWHLAREFQTPPTLNGSFIECTPSDRIYQDKNMPEVVLNVQNNVTARRLVGRTASMGQDL